MAKKKKIILFTLLSITLIMAGVFYYAWSVAKEKEKAVKWVTDNGGEVTYEYPEWVEKCPVFMQGTVKKMVGEDVVGVFLTKAEVSDISDLKSMVNLKYLDLSHTEVSDISALKNLTNLKFLSLHNSEVMNINALENLTNLMELHLSYTKVKDIKALWNLENLLTLNLAKTQITEKQIQELTLNHSTGFIFIAK